MVLENNNIGHKFLCFITFISFYFLKHFPTLLPFFLCAPILDTRTTATAKWRHERGRERKREEERGRDR
jgi:hypothetical protein